MIRLRQATRIGFWWAVIAFLVLLALPDTARSKGDNCVPLVGHPGAVVCGGRVDGVAVALAAPVPTIEVIVADPLPAVSKQPKWTLPSCRELWPLFVRAGERYGVDPVLVQIVGLVESGCGQAQSSGVGAQGIMQVMPTTAAGLGAQPGWQTDAAENIRLGAKYLAASMKTYGQPESVDPDYARAIRLTSLAYNGGPGMALRELRGQGVATESSYHARWVTGMWAERHAPKSDTLETWCGLTRWCLERGQ